MQANQHAINYSMPLYTGVGGSNYKCPQSGVRRRPFRNSGTEL